MTHANESTRSSARSPPCSRTDRGSDDSVSRSIWQSMPGPTYLPNAACVRRAIIRLMSSVSRVTAPLRSLLKTQFGSGGAGGDLRYAVRSLRRAPWYSVTVIGVIALGMSLATTVFAVVDGVLFKPLPYPDAGRLFGIQPGYARGVLPEPGRASAVDIANWAEASGAGVTGFSVGNQFGLGEGANEPTYGVAQVQQDFFNVIGVHPLRGGFSSADFTLPSNVFPAVISYELWQGHFLGDPNIVGRRVIGDPSRGSGYQVVGVMPAGFLFPSVNTSVSLIAPFSGGLDRGRNFPEVIVRAPASSTAAVLRARIEAGMQATASLFPSAPQPTPGARPDVSVAGRPYDHAGVVPLAQVMGARQRPLFAAIFAATLVLVALGALNTSGLMATRALDRARELGVRRALGAGSASIARLLIAEAVTLIGVGSALGLLAAPWLLHVGLLLLPVNIPLLKMPAIDWRVAGFVVLSALALTGPTTIWPIRKALRVSAASLGDGGRSSERHRSVGRQLVVALQIAGAVVLTVTGGLLVSSLLAVYAHESGVQTDDVVSIGVTVQGPGAISWRSPERTARVDGLVSGLRAMPGVSAVAATSGQILRGTGWTQWFHPPDQRAGANKVSVDVSVMAVTSEFYQVIRPVVVAGRLPTDAELSRDANVVVVSESLARAFWPGSAPIGRMLAYREDSQPFTVVGVVQDAHLWRLDDDTAAIYGPYSRLSRNSSLRVFVRATTGHVGELVNDTPGAIERLDPMMRARGAMTLDDQLTGSIQPRRLQSWMFGSFAASALAIVCVGVFGLTAMANARRTREVGIRMVLGSTRPRVVVMLVREQVAAVGVGLIAGAVGAAWVGQFLRWYLYKLSAYDLRVWMLATLAIVSVAAIGTVVPGLRASRVDPAQALRAE